MQIEPLHFGSEGRRLFGCYHVPAGESKNTGVLVCPPLFTEYFRAHGSLKRLADRLARRGFHVLRFDYFGTGDSEGASEEITIGGCIADIEQGIQELQSLSGTRRVCLIGARVGADLGLRVAHRHPGISKAILWDPILDGSKYLEELRRRHEALVESHANIGENDRNLVGWGREVLGFRVLPSLLSQIEDFTETDFMAMTSQASSPVSFVTTTNCSMPRSHSGPADKDKEIPARSIEIVEIEFDCDWFNFWDGEFFPHLVIDEIVERA